MNTQKNSLSKETKDLSKKDKKGKTIFIMNGSLTIISLISLILAVYFYFSGENHELTLLFCGIAFVVSMIVNFIPREEKTDS